MRRIKKKQTKRDGLPTADWRVTHETTKNGGTVEWCTQG